MNRTGKLAAAGVALAAFAGVLVAQAPALTRTVVFKADVSVPGREAVIARVEVAPGGVAGWHTHPGDEISYVAEGEATLMIAGQPPRKFAAGEGFVDRYLLPALGATDLDSHYGILFTTPTL